MLDIKNFYTIAGNILPFIDYTGNSFDISILTKFELFRNFERKNKQSNLSILMSVEELFLKKKYDIYKLDFVNNIETINYLKSIEIIKNVNKNSPIYIVDNSILIIFFDEDDLRITVYQKGYNLNEAYKKILKIGNDIQEVIDYEFHFSFGFLTKNINNLGLGIKISTTLYSPYFRKNSEDIISKAKGLGIVLDFEEIGADNYKLFLKELHTDKETDIVENFGYILNFICEEERKFRIDLFNKDKYTYLQYISESKNRLKYSYLLSYEILRNIMLNYMFGNSVGIIEDKELLSVINYYLSFNDDYFEAFEKKLTVENDSVNLHQKNQIIRANLLREIIKL